MLVSKFCANHVSILTFEVYDIEGKKHSISQYFPFCCGQSSICNLGESIFDTPKSHWTAKSNIAFEVIRDHVQYFSESLLPRNLRSSYRCLRNLVITEQKIFWKCSWSSLCSKGYKVFVFWNTVRTCKIETTFLETSCWFFWKMVPLCKKHLSLIFERFLIVYDIWKLWRQMQTLL